MGYTYHCGIDLGSRQSQIAVIDEEQRVLMNVKLSNRMSDITSRLAPYRAGIQVVVESTYNWYWLVDGLRAAEIPVTLAHTAGLAAISSAKVKTDRRDAVTLARLLRAGMIPSAYIYPSEHRPTRDLLRHRWDLVCMRATEYRRLRLLLNQHGICEVGLGDLKALDAEEVDSLLQHPLARTKANLELERVELFDRQIASVERELESLADDRPEYALLQEIPGIGRILAMTLLYEIGDISRFGDVRHFASYCRVVPGCADSSTTKRRGRNDKSGNPYLKWALTQAATKAVAHYPRYRTFFDRQMKSHGGRAKKIVAYSITAHLLARAVFHVLTHREPYNEDILFRNQPST
jgi:transposase